MTAKTKSKNNRISLKESIDKVANQCQVDKKLILENVQEALRNGYNKEINPENELIIEIEKENEDLILFENLKVVDKVENEYLEINLEKAKKINAKIQIGEKLKKPIALSDFSYFAIMKVSQVIRRFLNITASEKIYHRFIDKKDKILGGTIENIDYRYFSVSLDNDNVVAFIPKEEQIPFERLRHGERIRFFVLDVFKNHQFGQIMGSRRCNEFLAALFGLEVPEVGSGVIKIEKIAREAGIRAKMAISCNDKTIDPIGSCIGRAGARINAVSQELKGEKIDIFMWDSNIKQFIINAASPSKIVNITFLEEKKVQIIVLETQYPAAIGKNGSAVRLLSKITGFEIFVETLEKYIEEVEKLELNGNLSHADLEKLEISENILVKCLDSKKKEVI